MRDSKRQRLLLFSGVLLVAVLLAGVRLLVLEPRRPRQVLRRGTVVTLEGVTIGRRHRIAFGKPWQRLLVRIHPGLRRFGGQLEEDTTPGDALECWFRVHGNPHDVVIPILAGCCQNEWRLWDEHGCAFPGVEVDAGDFRHLANGDLLLHPVFSSFPRRGGPVRISLTNTLEPLATFTTHLGAAGSFPPLRPESFPIVRRSGGTEFSLTGLRIHWPEPNATNANYRLIRFREPIPEIEFRSRDADGTEGRWAAWKSTTWDATGNRAETWAHYEFGEAPIAQVEGLCRREPAWKVRVQFARRDPQHAPPDRTWICRVHIPGPGQFIPARNSSPPGRAQLTFVGSAGSGECRSATPGFNGDGKDAPPRVGFARPSDEPFLVTLLATRRVGEAWRPYRSSDRLPATAWAEPVPGECPGNPGLFLYLPGVTGTVDLKIAIHTTRTVEFVAHPDDRSLRATARKTRFPRHTFRIEEQVRRTPR